MAEISEVVQSDEYTFRNR